MGEPALGDPSSSTFVHFSDREEVLEKLRQVDGYEADLEPLFRLASERLAGKTYDRSAFVFILIELIYEFEGVAHRHLGDLLSGAVLVLTEDVELAGSAWDAYQEIKNTLVTEEASTEVTETTVATEASGEERPDRGPKDDDTRPIPLGLLKEAGEKPRSEHERLMLEMQWAQKRVADMGLSARMAIDMALTSPAPDDVNHSLREISSLSSTLRRFEELLREAEERVLEAIGILRRE